MTVVVFVKGARVTSGSRAWLWRQDLDRGRHFDHVLQATDLPDFVFALSVTS